MKRHDEKRGYIRPVDIKGFTIPTTFEEIIPKTFEELQLLYTCGIDKSYDNMEDRMLYNIRFNSPFNTFHVSGYIDLNKDSWDIQEEALCIFAYNEYKKHLKSILDMK